MKANLIIIIKNGIKSGIERIIYGSITVPQKDVKRCRGGHLLLGVDVLSSKIFFKDLMYVRFDSQCCQQIQRTDNNAGIICPSPAARTIFHQKSGYNAGSQGHRIERIDDEYCIKAEEPVAERLQDLGSIGRKQINPNMGKQHPEYHPRPRAPACCLLGVPAVEAPS